jgi:hypothetical protein
MTGGGGGEYAGGGGVAGGIASSIMGKNYRRWRRGARVTRSAQKFQIPTSKLSEKHQALKIQRRTRAIGAGSLEFLWIRDAGTCFFIKFLRHFAS